MTLFAYEKNAERLLGDVASPAPRKMSGVDLSEFGALPALALQHCAESENVDE